MTTREKRLVTIVAAVAAAGVAVKVVYPHTIKRAFDVEDEIVELTNELADLEEERDRVDDALLAYNDLLERTGEVDALKVRNRLQSELEAMVRRADLESPDTRITPKKPVKDRKTGIHTVPVAISAEGELQRVIEFLEKCYELPYVARFKDVKLSPAGSKRGKSKVSDRVKLQATYEALTLPEATQAEGLIDIGLLEQPVEVVKHAGTEYAMIWERQPFNEYVEPTREQPRPTQTDRPKTSEPKGAEPIQIAGDRDRRDKYVAGVLRYGVDELLIKNEKRKTQEYVAKGAELDGGTLLYVHPYGGIVRKQDGDYFYAVGKLLSEAVLVEDAADYPEIQAVGVQLARLLPRKTIPPRGGARAGFSGRSDDADQASPTADGPDEDAAKDGDKAAEAEKGKAKPAARKRTSPKRRPTGRRPSRSRVR